MNQSSFSPMISWYFGGGKQTYSIIYVSKGGMKINADKTKIMIISTEEKYHKITIRKTRNGEILQVQSRMDTNIKKGGSSSKTF